MTNEGLYNTIFQRKSIRKYDMIALPQETLVKIQEFASNVKVLDESIKYELSYLTTEDVKNLLPIKAPHYICVYSENKDGYLMNAGFVLQQLDLFLSANNLGSCWLGMAKPSKDVKAVKNGLEFVIMLAFGSSKDELHRVDKLGFKRKNLGEISSIKDMEDVLEPVRLAPSASNSQPWFFSGNKSEITVSREKLNFIKAPLYKRMNQVDIGIALLHLWLSLDHQGKTAEFNFTQGEVLNGYEFMAKVKVDVSK